MCRALMGLVENGMFFIPTMMARTSKGRHRNTTQLCRATSSIRMTVRYVWALPIENQKSMGLYIVLPGWRHAITTFSCAISRIATSHASQRRLGRRRRAGGRPALYNYSNLLSLLPLRP
jgi:hypothetical protein